MLVVDKGHFAALLPRSMFHYEVLALHSRLTDATSFMKRYPQIKRFIVQDLPETREAAESFIAAQGMSDRVTFEAQDFFKPQKRKGKYVFVMQRGVYIFNCRLPIQSVPMDLLTLHTLRFLILA